MPETKSEKLMLVTKPRARLVLFETQLALTPNAPHIYRYSTAHRVVFERHSFADGRELWYKVTK
jgi:hypothetical protein